MQAVTTEIPQKEASGGTVEQIVRRIIDLGEPWNDEEREMFRPTKTIRVKGREYEILVPRFPDPHPYLEKYIQQQIQHGLDREISGVCHPDNLPKWDDILTP